MITTKINSQSKNKKIYKNNKKKLTKELIKVEYPHKTTLQK